MKFLLPFLRRLCNRPTPPPAAPSVPEPLPDTWLADLPFDLSRLTVEQVEQKAADHEAEANSVEELTEKQEAESLERQVASQAKRKKLEDEIVDLQLEEQRLRGALQYTHWVRKLCLIYGEKIGTKLANHEIEPGMTRDQLLFTYGVPEEQNITVVGNRLIFRYGSVKRGAYFELVDNLITQVVIVTPPPYPPHAFDDCDEETALKDDAP